MVRLTKSQKRKTSTRKRQRKTKYGKRNRGGEGERFTITWTTKGENPTTYSQYDNDPLKIAQIVEQNRETMDHFTIYEYGEKYMEINANRIDEFLERNAKYFQLIWKYEKEYEGSFTFARKLQLFRTLKAAKDSIIRSNAPPHLNSVEIIDLRTNETVYNESNLFKSR